MRCPTDEQLKDWAHDVRRRYRANSLSPEMICKIEQSIPNWQWDVSKKIIDVLWLKNEIVKYRDGHNGKYPTKRSGVIGDSDNTYAAVDLAMSGGYRGFEKGGSLSKFKAKHFGVTPYGALYTYDVIISWIQKYCDKYNCIPVQKSGIVEFAVADGYEPSITWSSIDGCLSMGRRGLPGGSSLATLTNDMTYGFMAYKHITMEEIDFWRQVFYTNNGYWPHKRSGVISEALEKYGQLTWDAVDQILRVGRRGLPGGSSLAFLTNGPSLNPSLEEIMNWMQEIFDETGQYPSQRSGVIVQAAESYGHLKWNSVNQRLRLEHCGLPKSSLAQLVKLLTERVDTKHI